MSQVERAGRSRRHRWLNNSTKSGHRRVTASKPSEQALERGHRRQALFHYALDGILLIGDDAHLLDVNPAACQLSGYPHHELLKKSLWDLIPPNFQQVARSGWARFLATGESSGEFVGQRADGTLRDFEYRAVAHVLPGVHLAHIRDITARKQAESTRQQYINRLEALSDIDRGILQAQSPGAVAATVLRQIPRLVPCARASVGLFDPSNSKATLLAVWEERPTAGGVRLELPLVGLKPLDDVLAGRSVVVSDMAADANPSPLERELLNEGLRAFLWVPLRVNQRTIGSLNFGSASPWIPSPEQHEIATEIANRLAVAIANAQLNQKSRVSGERLADISKHLLEVQEAERREIARELHDEIGQALTGLKLGLGVARKKTCPEAVEEVCSAERLVDQLIQQIRRLSLNLRPPVLDEVGLLKSLLWHFERFTTQAHIAVHFAHTGLDRRFSPPAETAAYRVVQEALTNVARHAGVMGVGVDVHADDCGIQIAVTDTGRGFDVAAVRQQGGGLGLIGMDERVALLGGRLTITSAPGSGTCVKAEIPTSA